MYLKTNRLLFLTIDKFHACTAQHCVNVFYNSGNGGHVDELLWKTQIFFLWNHWNNYWRAISSGSYIIHETRFIILYGPVASWIITNWKQHRWGQRVEIGLLYIHYFPFAYILYWQQSTKSPPSVFIIYLYAAHNIIQTT